MAVKYFILYLISFNCLAQEITNECGQTKDQWTVEIIRCLTIVGNEVVESGFDLETGYPELSYNVMTVEEFENDWERIE